MAEFDRDQATDVDRIAAASLSDTVSLLTSIAQRSATDPSSLNVAVSGGSLVAALDRLRTLIASMVGVSGYNLLRTEQWLYAFLAADIGEVKVGLVSRPDRIPKRMVEVQRKTSIEHLELVASAPIGTVNDQEAEHYEWVVRHYLTVRHGFVHSGRTDWLALPDPPPTDWHVLLEAALGFVRHM